MLRANRLRFYVSPTSALQALFNLREQHGQRSGEATRLLDLPPHAQLQPQPMVCSAKQNYLQTPRSSTTLCLAPLLSNQQTQLTISRNSLLSAETASYQQNYQLYISRTHWFSPATMWQHPGSSAASCAHLWDLYKPSELILPTFSSSGTTNFPLCHTIPTTHNQDIEPVQSVWAATILPELSLQPSMSRTASRSSPAISP